MEVIKCASTDEVISNAKRLNKEDFIINNEISCSFRVYNNSGNTLEIYIYYYH